MPEMNGRELAKEPLSGYPNLKCIFMSGWTAEFISDKNAHESGSCIPQWMIKELQTVLPHTDESYLSRFNLAVVG